MDYQNNNNNNLNKSEIKTINKKIVVLVLIMITIIVSVSYAYFSLYAKKRINVGIAIENTLNVNLVLSANSNLTLNVDPLVTYNENIVARSVTNTDYASLTNNSGIDNISCEYEIWYEATTTYHNSLTNTNNDLEFAIVGHDLSGQNPDFIFNLNNVTGAQKMYDAIIYTSTGVNNVTQNWEFALEHYNLNVNQNEQMNHSYSGKIYFKEKGCSSAMPIAQYLSNRNTSGYRGEQHNSNATYNMYRYVGAAQSSSDAYAGKVDNFICLGSNELICPEDNLYQIIGSVASDDSTLGLEAGMVKVIKYSKLGNYSWVGATSVDDSNGTINSSNANTTYTCTDTSSDPNSGCFPTWNQSYLNTGILNGSYLNSLSFKNKIAEVKWHCLVNSNTATAAAEYASAVCSSTPSKVSLMYVTDYSYGYNNGATIPSGSKSAPWLKIPENTYEWTMANSGMQKNSSSYSFYAKTVSNTGSIGGGYTYYVKKTNGDSDYIKTFPVRPVFYLKPDVLISSGAGTAANPFRLAEDMDSFSRTIIAQGIKTSSQDGSPWEVAYEDKGLRFEGKDPDNYVCFSSSCTDDELYRMIGKFTEMVDTDNDSIADTPKKVVKLIKYKDIGGSDWDTNGVSNWANATLKNILNTYWESPNNKALTVRWNLPNGTYTDAKIGIPCHEDYHKSVIKSYCSRDTRVIVFSYDAPCFQNNWLYMDATEGKTYWTINADTISDTRAYVVGHNASNRAGDVLYSTVTSGAYVYPVFYIDANAVSITSGVGSKANPYILN